MSDIQIKYGDSIFTCSDNNSPVYANRNGIQYYSNIAQNPEYVINNRSLPSTEYSLSVQNINKMNRDLFFDLFNTTLLRGKNLFTLIDHKKRLLFECFWQQWKEQFKKVRGGIYSITIDTESPYPWTPPLFAFYPFNGTYTLNDYCYDSNSNLTLGDGGSIVSNALVLTETVSATYAARNNSLSWFQQKNGSSISLLAQFRCGTIVNGSTIDIVKISDGSNTLRLYATYSADSSSSASSTSNSSLSTSSNSSSDSNSSSSLAYSSSSVNSSSSRGSSASSGSSSSQSSSSSSSLSSSSSSSMSSSQGFSSSSSSSSSLSSSSSGFQSSLSSLSMSMSSASGSTSSASSPSSSSSTSSNSSSSSSSVEGSTEMTIGFEWTKAGETPEYISIDEVNNYSDGVRAWYDICGTFDNTNNKFYLYIKRAGDSSKTWSYSFDYLYGTSSLTQLPENCLLSDTSPTNYPENVIWTELYLLQGDQANIYTTDADKAELNYAMIIDGFIPPTEYNWIRRLFHYWNKSNKGLPV